MKASRANENSLVLPGVVGLTLGWATAIAQFFFLWHNDLPTLFVAREFHHAVGINAPGACFPRRQPVCLQVSFIDEFDDSNARLDAEKFAGIIGRNRLAICVIHSVGIIHQESVACQ